MTTQMDCIYQKTIWRHQTAKGIAESGEYRRAGMMHERLKQKYRKHFSQPEIIRWWGSVYTVTPAVVDKELGDGNQIIYFTPLNTRPWFYVLFVDSSWDMSADEFRDDPLDAIYDAIEDEFGSMCQEGYEFCKNEGDGESCGRHHEDDAWFPVLSADSGCSWGECVNLAKGDGIKELQYLRRRTERPEIIRDFDAGREVKPMRFEI